MSSWLSLPLLPNPFNSQPDDDDDHSPPQSPAGVKQDLSLLTQSITRQLRGVASFLAPPPLPHSDDDEELPSPSSNSQTLTGIKNDLVEIGGTFKSSLSLLSTNKAVSEISRFTSNFLHFDNQPEGDEDEDEEEEDYEDAVGITDEVIDFVGEISLRSELWTDFPLSINKDFDMSDVQKDHASAIENLVPRLTALRHKIESYLSKEQFWIIYFVLLLPRLNEDDSELLSTPEIVEVRETLLQKLKSKHNTRLEASEEHESSSLATEVNNTQTMKHPPPSSKLPSDNVNAPERIIAQDHETSDDEEVDVNTATYQDTRRKPIENEDEISFSDLEDDGNDLSSRMSGFGLAQSTKVSSPSTINKGSSQSSSSEWVRLKENSGTLGGLRKDGRSTSREKDSESEGSNDWLTVDKTDFD